MIQKEVAERLMAKPRTNATVLFGVIQYYADVTYGFTVPAGRVKPLPKWIRRDPPGIGNLTSVATRVHDLFTKLSLLAAGNWPTTY